MHDLAPHGVRPAEEAGRGLDIALREELADPGRRDAAVGRRATGRRRSHRPGSRARAPSSRRSSGVPAPPRPNRKSVPTSTVRAPSAPTRIRSTKLARLERRERFVEAQHERRVDARLGEELRASASTPMRSSGQSSGRRRLSGLRSNVTATTRAPCGGIHLRPLEHGAVPRVHAVELADRDDRRAEVGGHLGRVAEDDHDVTAAAAASVVSRSSTGGCVTSHHRPKNGSTSGMNR